MHPVHITQWKKVVLGELPPLLSRQCVGQSKDEEALQAALSQQSGPLTVELDWLQKNGGQVR